MPWTPICEAPNFWSEKKLSEYSKSKNVATVLGHDKDEKGLELYLNDFDDDSQYVYQITHNKSQGLQSNI
jgi:hypothetical protein